MSVSTLRNEEFLRGTSGSLISCRLGILITIRLFIVDCEFICLEAIFSVAILLGIRNIKFNLRDIILKDMQLVLQRCIHTQ